MALDQAAARAYLSQTLKELVKQEQGTYIQFEIRGTLYTLRFVSGGAKLEQGDTFYTMIKNMQHLRTKISELLGPQEVQGVTPAEKDHELKDGEQGTSDPPKAISSEETSPIADQQEVIDIPQHESRDDFGSPSQAHTSDISLSDNCSSGDAADTLELVDELAHYLGDGWSVRAVGLLIEVSRVYLSNVGKLITQKICLTDAGDDENVKVTQDFTDRPILLVSGNFMSPRQLASMLNDFTTHST